MILRLQHQRPYGEVDSYYLKPGRRYHIGRGSTCEIRVLDLKLSRKHCAVEFSDDRWQAVDLMSTNGCTLNGVQIIGNAPLFSGSVIEAGQTRLTVADIMDPAHDAAAAVSANSGGSNQHDAEAVHHDHTETTAPDFDPSRNLEQEALPDGPNNVAGKNDAHRGTGRDWEPEPNSDAFTKTDALIPHPPAENVPVAITRTAKTNETRRPTAVFRADQASLDDYDTLGTRTFKSDISTISGSASIAVPNNLGAAPTPGTDSQERTFYITLLGRRVGPLTRSAARELKSRELKGTLTTADLEQYPL